MERTKTDKERWDEYHARRAIDQERFQLVLLAMMQVSTWSRPSPEALSRVIRSAVVHARHS